MSVSNTLKPASKSPRLPTTPEVEHKVFRQPSEGIVQEELPSLRRKGTFTFPNKKSRSSQMTNAQNTCKSKLQIQYKSSSH